LSFEIKLPLFEGPFDLLLFFIERDELDIYDIPIAKITDDFLEYLSQMEKLNIEVASEFILVAATLMRIKSKMLLPRPVLDEEGNEIDPREELVKHLLEYKKYKGVVAQISQMEAERSMMEKRGNVENELKVLAEKQSTEAELQDIDLYKLLKVYLKVKERHRLNHENTKHTVIQYPFTIAKQKEYLLAAITIKKGRLSFTDILNQNADRIAVIFNFLAILELLQLDQISITIGEGYNNFWIEKKNTDGGAAG